MTSTYSSRSAGEQSERAWGSSIILVLAPLRYPVDVVYVVLSRVFGDAKTTWLLQATIRLGSKSLKRWQSLNALMSNGRTKMNGGIYMRLMAQVEAHALGHSSNISEIDKSVFVQQLIDAAVQNNYQKDNVDDGIFAQKVLSQLLWYVTPSQREQYADLAAMRVKSVCNYEKPLLGNTSSESSQAAALSSDGVVSLGQIFSERQVTDVLGHLSDKPCKATHYFERSNEKLSTFREIQVSKAHYASYSREVVLSTPHLLEVCNATSLIDIVSSYLGCPATLQSLNLFWTFSTKQPGGVSVFHRDQNDFRSVSFYMFLSKVDLESGSHEYIRGSTNLEFCDRRIREANLSAVRGIDFFTPPWAQHSVDAVFQKDVSVMSGPAGTAFISDGYGLHRGVVPRGSDRLLFIADFGIMPLDVSGRNSRLTSSEFAQRIVNSPDSQFRNRVIIRA